MCILQYDPSPIVFEDRRKLAASRASFRACTIKNFNASAPDFQLPEPLRIPQQRAQHEQYREDAGPERRLLSDGVQHNGETRHRKHIECDRHRPSCQWAGRALAQGDFALCAQKKRRESNRASAGKHFSERRLRRLKAHHSRQVFTIAQN